jgi:hypothetical protein
MKPLIKKIGGGFDISASSNPWLKPSHFDWTQEETLVNLYIDEAISNNINGDNKNFLWLLESPIVLQSKGVYEYLANNLKNVENKFELIFTNDIKLINASSKIKYVHSDIIPWVFKHEYDIYKKTKLCSILATCYKVHPGHLLRHHILNEYGKLIDHYGTGYSTELHITKIIDGFKDYMFSFCIENCATSGYWGSKLSNAIVTGTVPIYWGDPNIKNVFNPKGFIFYNDDFKFDIINPETYNNMLPYIKENFEIAVNQKLPEDFMFEKYLYAYFK